MSRPIAGAGFAVMAWRLAHERTGYPAQRVLLDRFCASIVPSGPSAAYYALLDSASTAFAHAIVMHGWEANTQLRVTL